MVGIIHDNFRRIPQTGYDSISTLEWHFIYACITCCVTLDAHVLCVLSSSQWEQIICVCFTLAVNKYTMMIYSASRREHSPQLELTLMLIERSIKMMIRITREKPKSVGSIS